MSEFELMINEYLNISEDNLKQLDKRNNKKAGKKKARCNKGSFELDLNDKDRR